MSGETQITIIGNITADPELKFIQSGAAVASFTIASTPRTFDKASNEWKDGEALFLRCSLWRQAAENAAETLVKGMRVIATGSLKQRSYEKDGQKRTVIELEVDEVGPSLKYSTAKVVKAERPSGGQPSGNSSRSAGQSQQSSGGWGGNPGNGGGQSGWGGNDTAPPF